MHRSGGTNNIPTERLADALMPETDAENGNRWRESAYDVCRDARLAWRAGTGRKNDVRGSEGRDVVERNRVVTTDESLPPQLADVPSQVIDKGVVVVDE
jgi:hypothetical protein